MNLYINEPPRQTPVRYYCRTAVVGGGFAGIAAALSAARAGSNVILLEHQYALGGLATLGLITHYLPLCDGYGHQVSFGIAEELMRVSMSLEDFDPLHAWKCSLLKSEPAGVQRLICEFNPQIFAILAEQLLLDAGVHIIYGANICGVEMTNDTVSALIAESREGRWAVQVENVIDCTGDATVCHLAGVQTKLFQQKNILASWYAATQDGIYHVQPLGACDVPDEYKTPAQVLAEKSSVTRYDGITTDSLSRFTIASHASLLSDFLRKGKPSAQHQLATIPAIPEVRMTRKIVGMTTLQEDTSIHYPDSIGLIANWKRRGPVYEVPFSCMCISDVKNLLAAGRCISTSETMWDVTRVIPPCAVTGEAAGLAAAMSADFHSFSVKQLQNELCLRGIVLCTKQI